MRVPGCAAIMGVLHLNGLGITAGDIEGDFFVIFYLFLSEIDFNSVLSLILFVTTFDEGGEGVGGDFYPITRR